MCVLGGSADTKHCHDRVDMGVGGRGVLNNFLLSLLALLLRLFWLDLKVDRADVFRFFNRFRFYYGHGLRHLRRRPNSLNASRSRWGSHLLFQSVRVLVLMSRFALPRLTSLKHGVLASSLSTSLFHALQLLCFEARLRTCLDILQVVGSGSALGKIRLECQLILALLVLVVFLGLVMRINLPASSIIQLLHDLF